jgi:lysophospholipase L1-like esterase
MRCLKTLACGIAILAILPAAAQAKAKTSYYVALGDSLSVGVQPDANGHNILTKEGYVDVLYKSQKRKISGLQLQNFGCGGEDTKTLMKGGICHYKKGSQLKQAESFLKAHKGQVKLLTIDIGANDVQSCAQGGNVDFKCISDGLATVKKNTPKIAKRLRDAAGSKTVAVAMTYYDPFLQYWLKGDDTNKGLAGASQGLAKSLNDTIQQAFEAKKFKTADVATAFDTYTPLTQTVNDPKFGTIPKAVSVVCANSWMCDPAPRGPNIHANKAGYKFIAKVFGKLL